VERYKEQKRRRFATPAEIKAIGVVLDRLAAESPIWICGSAFIYALLFTGARPSEIERATPDMLERLERDGESYGVLRIEKGKTGQRDVFLPPQAMALFDKMPKNRRHLCGDYHRKFPRALWEKVKKEVGCSDLWGRDLRRTFATVALSNGVPIGQVGELLGHKSSQTTKIYAKLMEDQAHMAAAVTATQIEGMLKGDEPPKTQKFPSSFFSIAVRRSSIRFRKAIFSGSSQCGWPVFRSKSSACLTRFLNTS
jgi:integrase